MKITRPPPIFIGDSPGIDFLNSTATPVDSPVEWLATGEDFVRWLARADLVPASALSTLSRRSLPGALDATAAQARGLREWFRGFVHRHKGRHLKSEHLHELAPLNQLLQREEAYHQIVKAEGKDNPAKRSPFVWRSMRRWDSPESLLIPIARAMAELVCNEDFVHVKSCEGPTCTLLFLDRTHSRARRWCSMAVCGNRAKQAAHRSRQARPRRP
jgi:predicted RNA-binding Zn ribbon-like protein